jgi:creatinine amidohydrolase/Fe(II)-dependent formamide hydrolase-like protein
LGVFLSELTWEDAKNAFERTQTVMMPLGSTEQHGPHLPLGADWIEADGLAKAVTSRADVITTQIIPVGLSEHHMDFPGTLTVTREHYKNFIMDISECLIRWGAKRFVFLSEHGGNLDALSEVALTLRTKYGALSAIPQWWEIVPEFNKQPTMQHAGYAEVAYVASIRPDLVKYERAQLPPPKQLSKSIQAELDYFKYKGMTVRTYLRTKDISSIGSMREQLHEFKEPDIKSATHEVGLNLLQTLADSIAEFIGEFNKLSTFEPAR